MPTNVPTKAPIKAPGGYTFRPPPPPLQAWEGDLASRAATLQNMMSPRQMPKLPTPPPAQLALPAGPGPAIPLPQSNPLNGSIGQAYAQAGVSGAPGELSSALGVPKSYLPPPPTPSAVPTQLALPAGSPLPPPPGAAVAAEATGIKGLASKILTGGKSFLGRGALSYGAGTAGEYVRQNTDQTNPLARIAGQIPAGASYGVWGGGGLGIAAGLGFGVGQAGYEGMRSDPAKRFVEAKTELGTAQDAIYNDGNLYEKGMMTAMQLNPGSIGMQGMQSLFGRAQANEEGQTMTGILGNLPGVGQFFGGEPESVDAKGYADQIKNVEVQARDQMKAKVDAAPDDIRSVYIDMGASRDTAGQASKQYEQAVKANQVMYERGMLTVPEYMGTMTNEEGTLTKMDGSELTPQDTAGWQKMELEDGSVVYSRPRAATEDDLARLNIQEYEAILQAAPETAAYDQAAEEQKRQQRNEMLGMQMATQRFLQPYVDQSNALSAQIGSFGPMYAPIAAGVQNQTNAFGMAAHLQPGLMMMEQQAAAQRAEAQRQAELEDWMFKEQYKAQHKAGSESGGSTSDSEEIAAGLTQKK